MHFRIRVRAPENATGTDDLQKSASHKKTASTFCKKSARFFKKSTPFGKKSALFGKKWMRHREKSELDFSLCLILHKTSILCKRLTECYSSTSSSIFRMPLCTRKSLCFKRLKALVALVALLLARYTRARIEQFQSLHDNMVFFVHDGVVLAHVPEVTGYECLQL